ncbi:DUF2316 family protein [Demequina iriomotensis]|uniref:DUF2316 family protein n=1 Tax=Demequina iriomotensis TaxID=1536641 RepID=UPI000785D0B1|nr:DUF2316 family protein [Demequina iriomotensis]
MSLTRTEIARTGLELTANLERSGLSRATAAIDLGFSERRLAETLAVGPASDPVDVWLLRDYLDRAIREHGDEPAPWNVLTEAAHTQASRWFALREAPRARDEAR